MGPRLMHIEGNDLKPSIIRINVHNFMMIFSKIKDSIHIRHQKNYVILPLILQYYNPKIQDVSNTVKHQYSTTVYSQAYVAVY
jgi:hypothetical protein